MKVSATLSAKKLLSELKEVHGDDLLFHQSGGCCDGSAPMCYPAKEYMVGNSDVKLGEVDGTPFYMNEAQLSDAVALRRATLANKVPYCTNMSTAYACLDAIQSLKNKKLQVKSLQEN